MKYALIDDSGFVVSVSSERQSVDWIQAPEWVSISPSKIRYEDGCYVQTDESWIPERTYAQQRSMAYPPIGDQLDVLWKALGSMLEDPRAEAMLAQIQAVKDRYPKPSN